MILGVKLRLGFSNWQYRCYGRVLHCFALSLLWSSQSLVCFTKNEPNQLTLSNFDLFGSVEAWVRSLTLLQDGKERRYWKKIKLPWCSAHLDRGVISIVPQWKLRTFHLAHIKIFCFWYLRSNTRVKWLSSWLGRVARLLRMSTRVDETRPLRIWKLFWKRDVLTSNFF